MYYCLQHDLLSVTGTDISIHMSVMPALNPITENVYHYPIYSFSDRTKHTRNLLGVRGASVFVCLYVFVCSWIRLPMYVCIEVID